MMKALLNSVRLQVQRAMASLVVSKIGSVTSYDPNTMTAVVELQPDGDLTGWLPVSSAWIGNGWGMFAPPNIGDLVDVVFINGNVNGGIIVGRTYNQQNQPLPVESGEFWLVHESGAFFKLLNTGALTISDGQGATVTLDGSGNINSEGTWKHTGTLDVTGDATFEKDVQVNQTLTATTDVIGGGVSTKNHLTSGVTSGTGTSGPPIP